jgi:hypothetical protein
MKEYDKYGMRLSLSLTIKYLDEDGGPLTFYGSYLTREPSKSNCMITRVGRPYKIPVIENSST